MKIDWWTLGLQTVNVAILVWLLQRFFWRPVAAMIELRRTTTQTALADAEATKAKAAAALKDIETTRTGFAKERETILTAAKETAEQTRAKLLDDAAKTASELQATATTAIEKERQAAEAEWSDRSSRLAIDIAGRLAVRLDGAAVRASFLAWLIKAIEALPETDRQATDIEVSSASALDPADQEQARTLIAKAFGGSPGITFKTDPEMIAGLELRGPHLMISNSWRADLAKIMGDLSHGS